MVKKNKKKSYLSKKYRFLRAAAVINIFLLVVNFTSYIFVAGPEIIKGKAQEVSFQLMVCPQTGSCTLQTYYRLENSQCNAVSIFPADAGSNDYTTLALCEANIGSATPTPTPTPTLYLGSAPPGLIVSPYKEKDVFARMEEGFVPYVKIYEVSGVKVISGQMTQVYNIKPEFLGITNLRRATIFLQYDFEPKKVYLVFADEEGYFSFHLPVSMEIGFHSLFLTAVSPLNPYFKAEQLFQFEILAIPQARIPLPRVSPSLTPTIAPVPEVTLIPLAPRKERTGFQPIFQPKPISITEDLYQLRTEIREGSKMIYPGEEIQFQIKISRIFPNIYGEDIIPLSYFIENEKGRVVFERTENLTIGNTIGLQSSLQTSLKTPFGKYTLIAKLLLDDMEFISTDTFEIKEFTFTLAPGLVVSRGDMSKILLKILWILLVIAIIFLVLLYLEHQRCRKTIQITEKDLMKDKDII